MPLPLLAVGQGALNGLTSFFRFGHAKAVAKENSAIGSAQNQIQGELEKIETQAREGQLSDAEIDSRLQAILDRYFSTVSSVIKGRIASESEFNPATKKTSSGGSCNAACVIGGQVADMVNEARPKLKAVAKQGREKKGGPAGETEVAGVRTGKTAQMGVAGPLFWKFPGKLPLWVSCCLLPGGLLLAVVVAFFVWRKRGK